MRITVLFLGLVLSGCATVESWLPSFWDDNQSARITDVRQRIESVDCRGDQAAQARAILGDLQWFELYSQSKGQSQRSVIKLVEPIKATAQDWLTRTKEGHASEQYCVIKQRILAQQAARAAESIMGRW